MPSTKTGSSSSTQDTSHIRMAAWLAVAAVAVSSGAVSFAASAADAPAAAMPKKPVEPTTVIMRELNALHEQGNRIEAAVMRVERKVNNAAGMMGAGNLMAPPGEPGSTSDAMRKQKEEMMRKQGATDATPDAATQ